MWKEIHTQQPSRPKIDLTRLKELNPSEYVHFNPFVEYYPAYRDYRDRCNLGRTNFIFKPKTFKTPQESFNTMLQTLNFS